MADEQQQDTPPADKPAEARAAPPAPAEDEITIERPFGVEPDAAAQPEKPEGDKPAEEEKPTLPLGVSKQLTREQRRAKAAERRAAEAEERLKKLETVGDVLRRLRERKPEEFDSVDDYEAVKAAAAELEPPAPVAPAVSKAESEAAIDYLHAAVTGADKKALWDRLVEQKDGKPVVLGFTPELTVELADADDPVATLAALLDLSNEERAEIAGLPPRAMRRALRELDPPKPAAATPPRGQFVKRQSAAPAPISPVSQPSSPDVSLAELAKQGRTDEYIERRNREDRERRSFGF